MKTTIEIADALAREAKDLARTRGETLRTLVESGLRRELDAHRTDDAGASAFRLRTAGGDGLRPGVDAARLTDYAYTVPDPVS